MSHEHHLIDLNAVNTVSDCKLLTKLHAKWAIHMGYIAKFIRGTQGTGLE